LSASVHAAHPVGFRSFRLRLVMAMMLIVGLLVALGLYFAQRNAVAGAERELHDEFLAAFDALTAAREVRALHLAQRCRTLVENARIHAALEDDALDLLYVSARDELSDLMAPETPGAGAGGPVRARFYRFLDAHGAVIVPPADVDAGFVTKAASAQLALPRLPESAQVGFISRAPGAAEIGTIDEIITTPITSTERRRTIAALVVGLAPELPATTLARSAIIRGVWVDGQLDLPDLALPARQALAPLLAGLLPGVAREDRAHSIAVAGHRYLLLCQARNGGSLYPVAYEVFLYPLDAAASQQRRLRWQILGAGALVLLGGLGVSHLLAVRLSLPVEQLAADSQVNALQRSRAEAALELTQAELERSARFSANASHQLKTPVAVLRAGLDELLARDDVPPAIREELQGLVGETVGFTGIIEDLLLLSRMDAGRLCIVFQPVDLTNLVAAALDDVSVLPDPFELKISYTLPTAIGISGERRYLAHILRNLFENACRYNRPGGRIEVTARVQDSVAILLIGNTGRSIPRVHQGPIFDRFHRGAAAENLPGHGLGLNLARELARLHGGDLRLVVSVEDWTEFEVTFPLARGENKT
jgi:signal transduction histidine kinase